MRRSLIPFAAIAAVCSFSALADESAGDGWNAQGGYAGVSGGLAFGSSGSDDGHWDSHRWRYTDDAPVDAGWQGTLEGGAVLPLGRLDWLRLRVGGEAGYGDYDLDDHHDPFSGDAVAGHFNVLRLGPAAALDFRVPNTPFSFTAGVGMGLGVVNLHASVANGGVVRNAGDHTTTAYVSGLVSANYALNRHLEVSLGVRSIWLAGTRIDGTTTTAGGTVYAVRHEIPAFGAVELGLRWTF